MTARRRARSIQLARVLKLVQGELDGEPQDAKGALSRLKSRVGGLRIDVEPSVLDELLSAFPALPREDGRRLLAESAVEGFTSARAEALSQLEGVERSQKPGGSDARG